MTTFGVYFGGGGRGAAGLWQGSSFVTDGLWSREAPLTLVFAGSLQGLPQLVHRHMRAAVFKQPSLHPNAGCLLQSSVLQEVRPFRSAVAVCRGW